MGVNPASPSQINNSTKQNMNPQNESSLEVLTPSAVESLERAQIDVQVATAHRFPRSLEQFKRRALDMVQQDIETAESCIYSRPVGKDRDTGKQKYAEGASIRMAEIVASCFGNIRFGARIIEQTERYVKAEGVCHDLESNTAGKSEAMESTVKSNGQPYDERMRIVVAKACLSKALRDAIFRVVPRALCKSIYDAAAMTISKQAKTLEQRRMAAKQWLNGLDVDEQRAFAVLEVAGWSEIGNEQLLTLTGLKTAIKDNEVTIAEAFPHISATQKSNAPTPPTPVTKPVVVPEASISKPAAASAAPSTPATAESGSSEATAPASAAPEPAQVAPEPSEPANSALSEPPQAEAPVVTGTPLEICRAKIAALDIPERQLMRYLQGLKPPIARGTQNELGQLADPKLVNIAAQLDSDAVVEKIKATAV